jgi:glycosyltransferase involved in cell wall biosynthesis
MKFLTVSHFFESHGGGIEIVAGSLSRALAERGHDVTWAAAAFDKVPEDSGITPLPLAAIDPIERLTGLPMPIPLPGALRALDRAVAASDAVIVHDALYLSSLAAAWAARRHRKPWILIQHVGAIPFSKLHLRLALGLANRVVTAPLLANAPQVIFISEGVRQQFGHISFRRPPALMFNGVDGSLFKPVSPEERSVLRQALNTTDFSDVFLFVGRFVDKKGLPAIRKLATARPESLFLLAGGGPCDPAQWNLSNVHPLGRCRREELARLYQACDALILPSSGEGYPLVVQEAMATGLPIFCGMDSAQADPTASPYLYGVEVNLADPDGTADRFDKQIRNATLQSNHAAADYARTTYDWAQNAATVEKMVRAIGG